MAHNGHVRCEKGVFTRVISPGVCVHSNRPTCVEGKAVVGRSSPDASSRGDGADGARREIDGAATDPAVPAASATAPASITPLANVPLPESAAIARHQWPAAARLLARLATAEDAGLGDTLYRAIGEKNSERFRRLFKSLMGYDCGCASRRARMNERFPLT
jgi:hypothetical protein